MLLVTGATGTGGRRLVDLLVGECAEVRAVTRDPGSAGLPAGVEIVEGDPSRHDTIAAFLEGVTAVFLHPRAAGDAAFGLGPVPWISSVASGDPGAPLCGTPAPGEQPSRYRGDRNKEAEEAGHRQRGSLTTYFQN